MTDRAALLPRGKRTPVGRRRRSILAALALALLVLVTNLSGLGSPTSGVLGVSSSGGVVLDGWGGLHTFGGATINSSESPYWPGWDIARSTWVSPDGSGGYTLDGWGGVHTWGAAKPLWDYGAYWKGWDIARSMVILPDESGGYVMDGYGGIHSFGSAPALRGSAYWPGWDIARGLDLHFNGSGVPDGGWQLDAWGGIHTFGAAPALASSHYYPGFDIFRSLHVVAGGAYEVGRWGIVEKVGAPAGANFAGYPSWGSWDIARDVSVLNASGAPAAIPFNRASAGAAMAQVHSVDRAASGLGGLQENGVLDSIAGNGATYNIGSCGGPSAQISDRTDDMLARDYFAHAIPGCTGTQYVFSTYMRADNLSYRQAGENIAWRGGDTSTLDDVWAINQMWQASPPHEANIVGPYSQIGCGVSFNASGGFQGASGDTWIWACEFMG